MLARCEPNHTGKNIVARRLGENKMKKWQDKTDEEFENDIMKMVEEGKLTKWDPWDHIKTLEEAKDYVEAIYEEWGQESQAANDCIVEILESYMEFADIMDKTIRQYAKLPDTINAMFTMLLSRTRNQWLPLLNQSKKKQEAQKSAKKSA